MNKYLKDAVDEVRKLKHTAVEFENDDYFVPIFDGFEFLSIVKNSSPVFIGGMKDHDVTCVVAEYKHRQTGIEMVLLPPLKSSVPENTGIYPGYAKFTMGSPNNEKNRKSREGPQHKVELSPFLIAKTETTQKQWHTITGNNPSWFKGDSNPVDSVSWDICKKEFCEKVGLKLPTEAQWEYACRAGTTTPFYIGNSLSSIQANFDGNYPYGDAKKGKYLEKTTAFGSYNPNAFGLYDMHGNLHEWCEDVYDSEFYSSTNAKQRNPLSTTGSEYRVLRGGSWFHSGYNCRSAYRLRDSADFSDCGVGFRCVFNLSE